MNVLQTLQPSNKKFLKKIEILILEAKSRVSDNTLN